MLAERDLELKEIIHQRKGYKETMYRTKFASNYALHEILEPQIIRVIGLNLMHATNHSAAFTVLI